jgi:hypothetical protein
VPAAFLRVLRVFVVDFDTSTAPEAMIKGAPTVLDSSAWCGIMFRMSWAFSGNGRGGARGFPVFPPRPDALAVPLEVRHGRSPARWLSGLGLVLLWFLSRSVLEASEQILSLAVTNYTGYVIAGDAAYGSAPPYNRDAIAAAAQLQFTEPGATPVTSRYRLVFRLLDDAASPVPILDELGATNTTYTLAETVTLPFTIFGITFHSSSPTYSAGLRPVARLDPFRQYTVELRLFKQAVVFPFRYVDTGLRATDGPRTYYHFPSTNSNDPELNVIAVGTGAAFTQTAMADGVAGKDAFAANVGFLLYRYDRFLVSPQVHGITVRLDYALREAGTGVSVPLVAGSATVVESIDTYFQPLDPTAAIVPRVKFFSEPLVIRPAPGIQLDAVGKTYTLTVAVGHVEVGGGPVLPANQLGAGPQRLLHFNGSLYFGAISTHFSSLASLPTPLAYPPGGVSTTLAVDGQSGRVDGKPDHTYGDGNALPVVLRANGNAEYTGAGAVGLTAPALDGDEALHVRFVRTTNWVDVAGAHGHVLAVLPTGFGYRSSTDSRILNPFVGFLNVPLTQALLPASDQVYPPLIYGCEETKPFWIESNGLVWEVGKGRFVLAPTGAIRYVREDELNRLAAAPVDPAMKVKPSNEQYLYYTDKVTSARVYVAADANSVALMSFEFELSPGQMVGHFPYGAQIVWHAPAQVRVEDDLYVPAVDQLTAVDPVTLDYGRDCTAPDCGPGKGPDDYQIAPEGGTLGFTLDGGLAAAGTVVTPKDLTWGWINNPAILKFAQRVEPFAEGNFHLPGYFLCGNQTDQHVWVRPALMLYTGVRPADLTQVERFGKPEYQAGLGDYAGINFRVGAPGAREAESVLAAKPTGLYPLTARSKYYVRRGGVSGIHEAVFGAFPPSLTLYGYPFKFANFGLSYLDSQNWESRTEGSVQVKYPSDFTQDFKELEFSCLGGLTGAKVPDSQAGLVKTMSYWTADFSTLAISFERKAADLCDPGKGSLVLGIEAYAEHLDPKLYGQVGFTPAGKIITRADGILDPPFDSRLKLPNNLRIKGPGSEQWSFEPVNDAYYNDYDHHPAAPGWLNVAGKLDAPFFEDLKVHLQTRPTKTGSGGPLYLMGGWPAHGFEWAPGKNHFNENPSDPDNLGFPAGVASLEDYRKGNPSSEQWLVRAQRNWLGVVDLDYPLAWSSTTRAFTSAKEVENNLLVLDVKHQAKYLSPRHAELAFGAQYTGLPQLNLANLAFDQLGGLQSAIDDAIGAGPRAALEAGFDRLNEMLEAQMRTFFKPAFDTLIGPRVDDLYNALKADYNAVPWNNFAAADAIVVQYCTGGAETFVKRFKQVADAGLGALDAVQLIDQNLGQVQTALHTLKSILGKAPDGSRQVVRQVVQQIAGQLAAQFASYFLDDKVNAALADLDPTFEQIAGAIDDLSDAVGKVRDALKPAGEFANELKAKVAAHLADITAFVTKAQGQIQDIFHQMDLGVDNPFVHYSSQQLRDLIRQKLEDQFFGSPVAADLQMIVKHRVYDLEASIRQAADSVFQQVNTTLRDIVSEVASELATDFLPFKEEASKVMGAAKINGYAHIDGDDLKLLRLDIYAQLKVPSDMELNAFLQIKELDSSNTPTGCLPPGGKATEVSAGANNVKVKWISPDLSVNLVSKFTFDPSGPGVPKLVNLMGGIEVLGEINLDPLKITYLGASIALGSLESYFSAAAKVQINHYVGGGGIFFGKTCTLDPFFWDKDVQSLLGAPPFTGAYAYGEVWIPISEALLGIPATCFFQISAGVGAGAGYFVEGPTFIGKMLLGASGDLLCIVSVSGEVKLIGIKDKNGLRLKGTGTLEGELCLILCIGFSKSVGMEYNNGSWSVDF